MNLKLACFLGKAAGSNLRRGRYKQAAGPLGGVHAGLSALVRGQQPQQIPHAGLGARVPAPNLRNDNLLQNIQEAPAAQQPTWASRLGNAAGSYIQQKLYGQQPGAVPDPRMLNRPQPEAVPDLKMFNRPQPEAVPDLKMFNRPQPFAV